MTVKSRFCPSPTGFIHLGNARTALFNALAARAAKGEFLLRIEDTDLERSKEEYTEALYQDLKWLGCDWDEGPGAKVEHGPYYQSERHDTYEKYYQQLLDQSQAYFCYCSEEELELSRKRQRRMGKPPRYSGVCKHLTAEQRAKKESKGIKPTLRFAVPENEIVEFEDIVRGQQKFQSNDLGDFIIRKTDGMPTFMYCNAVDDSLMGVTLALRGEDHLTNTPRQLLILQALKLRKPQYGHISLITGEDGSPLSKRNGSRSIQQLREEGFLPLAIVNYLARLGHVYTDRNDLMTFADCAKFFSLGHLVKASARYDENQVRYWQKEAVLRLSFEEFKAWLSDLELSRVPSEKFDAFLQVIQPNVIFSSEVKEWESYLYSSELNFDEELLTVLQQAGANFFDTAIEALATVASYQELCAVLKEKLRVKGKGLFMPLRIAMTQQGHGPELAPIFDLLGKEAIAARFKQVREIL